MKNKLLSYLPLLCTILIGQACSESCKIDVGAIEYDQTEAVLSGDQIGLRIAIDNPENCVVDYQWSTSAGTVTPASGSATPTLMTDCKINNYTVKLDLKNENGKILYTRSLEIKTRDLPTLDVSDEYVSSGFFGDVNSIKLEPITFKGKQCDRFSFNPYGSQGFAGVYYQYPANNWGDQEGKDLSGYNKLKFWVCSPDGAAVNFIAGGVSDNTKPHKDSFKGVTGYKILTEEWEELEIDLKNRDLSRVIGGFAWVSSREYNPSPVSFYIADIRYIRENCE